MFCNNLEHSVWNAHGVTKKNMANDLSDRLEWGTALEGAMHPRDPFTLEMLLSIYETLSQDLDPCLAHQVLRAQCDTTVLFMGNIYNGLGIVTGFVSVEKLEIS